MKSALAALLAGCLASGGAAYARDPLVVVIDRAKILRIAAPASTIIIGNPAIADAAIHDKQTIVLTGRRAGTTNVVVLDVKGEPVLDEVVTVAQMEAGWVIVQRGQLRQTYACTPNCAATLGIGDENEAFKAAKTQIDAVNGDMEKYAGSGKAN